MTKRWGLILLWPLLVFALAYTAVRYLACVIGNPAKAWNIALMIDQTANVGINGRVDESISARAAKAMYAGRKWGCVLCWILGRIQTNHCQNALADDEE